MTKKRSNTFHIVILTLLFLLQCSCTNQDIDKLDDQVPAIKLMVRGPIQSKTTFDKLFNEHYVVPMLGGPLYNVTAIKDIVTTGDLTYIAVGGHPPSIHVYEKGRYVRTFEGSMEGSENRLNGISAIVPTSSGGLAVLDRSGQQIIFLDQNLSVIKSVFTGLYSADFALTDHGFLVDNMGERGLNKGRLSQLNAEGAIVQEFHPVTDKNDHINIYRLNSLNRQTDGGILYHESYNPAVNVFRNDSLITKYVIDFGNRGVPADYFDKPFANIMEFAQPLAASDYWHNVGNFIETDRWITFGFSQGTDRKLARIDKSNFDQPAYVTSTLVAPLLLPDIEIENHYLNGPLGATASGYLFWLIPEDEIDEDARKLILEQVKLSLTDDLKNKIFDAWNDDYRFSMVFAR